MSSWEGAAAGREQSSSHSSQGQYNPFHEEDQRELVVVRKSRLYDARFARNTSSGGVVRYNPTIQHDPEDQTPQLLHANEIISFIERDRNASGNCRQLFSFSTLIIVAQVRDRLRLSDSSLLDHHLRVDGQEVWLRVSS
jgi:hypothetical protein